MFAALHLIKKETVLLLRDWNALLLLFVMPAIFILVMSLALQNRFAAQTGEMMRYYLVNLDHGVVNADLIKRLDALSGFQAVETDTKPSRLKNKIGSGAVRFLVVVPEGFGASIKSQRPASLKVTIAVGVGPVISRLFAASLKQALGQFYLAQITRARGESAAARAPDFDAVDKLMVIHANETPGGSGELPTSVQQNVPAWLLFAMFFIAIPLSTTWVQERAQGTYTRLRGMGLNASTLLAGKLFPYVILNLVQVVLMLLIGVYIVPLFGAGPLTLGGSWGALVLVSVAASLATVSYALLVANVVSTSEQATIVTGVANLLMAALGGIMVPRFVMPDAMQVVSHYSPMAWGLDGFLTIFLRGGGVGAVTGPVVKLGVFALICLIIAAGCMSLKRER